jgi:hypothetical protein
MRIPSRTSIPSILDLRSSIVDSSIRATGARPATSAELPFLNFFSYGLTLPIGMPIRTSGMFLTRKTTVKILTYCKADLATR